MDVTGQVALVHQRGFWPSLITVVTSLIAERPEDAHWNHMLTAISPTECMSAERKGVTRRKISDFPGAVWSDFDETELQRDLVADFAAAQDGKPYAFLDDFFIGVGIIMRRRTPAWLRRRLRSGKRWECAELAGASLACGGITNIINDDRPFAAAYPASYAPVWRARGWLRKPADLTLGRYWRSLTRQPRRARRGVLYGLRTDPGER